MGLDHAAFLEVLEVMKSARVDDRVETAAATIYQALIDAELTAVIDAGPWEHTPEADRSAQWLPAEGALDPRRGLGAVDPEAALGIVLPFAAGSGAAASTRPSSPW